MSFLAKKDYSGLSATYSSALAVRKDSPNISTQAYRPVDNDGEIFAEEIYGEDAAPSNDYGLKGQWATTAQAPLTIGAGVITTVDSKKYGRENITINTGAGSPVTVSATAQQLEDGASTDGTVFKVPAFTLTTAHKAQDIFGAIDEVTNGSVTQLNYAISCTISKDKIAGVKYSSGANTGLLTITGKLLQKSTAGSAAEPGITLNTGFTLVNLTPDNPESTYPEYSFTITRPLELVRPVTTT